MSWLVETTLLTKEDIKANYPFDSDEYFTLLAIEIKIEELKKAGILDREELYVLEQVVEGGSYSSLEDYLGINRTTIARRFKSACYKISFALGGEFTDEGLLQKVADRYELSNEQCDIMREYIQGNLRHKIRRTSSEG